MGTSAGTVPVSDIVRSRQGPRRRRGPGDSPGIGAVAVGVRRRSGWGVPAPGESTWSSIAGRRITGWFSGRHPKPVVAPAVGAHRGPPKTAPRHRHCRYRGARRLADSRRPDFPDPTSQRGHAAPDEAQRAARLSAGFSDRRRRDPRAMMTTTARGTHRGGGQTPSPLCRRMERRQLRTPVITGTLVDRGVDHVLEGPDPG
jgi:hypothetical protein